MGPSCDCASLDELAAIPTLRNPPSDSIHSLDPADLDDNARLNDSDLLLDLSLNVLAEISTEDCSSNDLSWNDVSMLFAHFENDNTTCQCWKCKTNSKLHYMSRRPSNRNFYVRQRTLKNVPIDNFTEVNHGLCNFLVTNCRSVFPKICGLVESHVNLGWEIAILSETWQSTNKNKILAQNEILDNISNLHGLNYIGEPRKGRRGGGVAVIYDNSLYKAEKLNFGTPPKNFEIIICKMSRLTPPVFNQFVFSCYFKPQMTSRDIESALAYLQMTITKIETKYKDPQLFLGADINYVELDLILNLHPNFHSLNKNATRGRKNIDIFVSNMAHLFKQGQVCQELQVDGLKSDHKQVLILKKIG